jgi:hypothetical protein
MKPVRGSKPASRQERDKLSPSNPPANSPQRTIKQRTIKQQQLDQQNSDRQERDSLASSDSLADSVQRIFEQQIQVIEQQKLDLQKLTQQWLDTLHAEVDARLNRMQTAAARAAMKRAFNASAEQLGKAAVDAARKRG